MRLCRGEGAWGLDGVALADRLAALLPEATARELKRRAGWLTEVRLRAGRPVQLVGEGFDTMCPEAIPPEELRSVLTALMDYSVYARQEELDEGFFTLDDGSRIGVCGRMYAEGGRLRMGRIGSACARVARAVPGCAEELAQCVAGTDGPRSTLLISPPGMGKTTLLRDLARLLSDAGLRVAVADERHELAACRDGVPMLDVGCRTDVMDGGDRSRAMRALLRSMAPQVIVADEIGGEGDGAALVDAARCGVAVMASAHGAGFAEALGRPWVGALLRSGAFDRAALLGPRPGELREIWRRKEDGAWTRE